MQAHRLDFWAIAFSNILILKAILVYTTKRYKDSQVLTPFSLQNAKHPHHKSNKQPSFSCCRTSNLLITTTAKTTTPFLLQNAKRVHYNDSKEATPWKWFPDHPDNPYKVILLLMLMTNVLRRLLMCYTFRMCCHTAVSKFCQQFLSPQADKLRST